jgi:CBS domain-containing protein
MRSRLVSELIHGQVVLALPREATVREATERMAERHVGAVLVTDPAGRVLGIFTERDAVYRVLARRLDPDGTALVEVMTPNPTTMHPRDQAMEALRLMQEGGFRHVPVVEGGRVVGMVSRSDFRGAERTRIEEQMERAAALQETLR